MVERCGVLATEVLATIESLAPAIIIHYVIIPSFTIAFLAILVHKRQWLGSGLNNFPAAPVNLVPTQISLAKAIGETKVSLALGSRPSPLRPPSNNMDPDEPCSAGVCTAIGQLQLR